jgi:DNA-binding transcriptional LysR family regulator
MDIDRLRYFAVLSDSSTMREAAEHLHISQPALSKAMKLLEHELGEQLLVASGRRVLITDRGKMIAERAKQILIELDKITKDKTSSDNDYIRIGSFEVFTTYFMGHLASGRLGKEKIQLREFTPGHLEEQLVIGNVDIGITYIPIPKSELEFIKINEIEMGIYGIGKKFKNTAFSDLPFAIPITPVQGAPQKVKGLDGWPDDKIPRNVRYQVELMETALEFCRQGLAVAYLPKFVVALHNQQAKACFSLHEIAPPKKLISSKQGVYVVKRKTDVEHPVYRQVAAALRNL